MNRCSKVWENSLNALGVLHNPSADTLELIANHFNGDNLLDCDQKILQEMGIKKIGDRVRIFIAIKQLRNKNVSNRKKRNRVS